MAEQHTTSSDLDGSTIELEEIDHWGHAVKDLPQAIKFYQEVLGFELLERETVGEQGVEVAFLRLKKAQSQTCIELLAVADGAKNSGAIEKFLLKRGPGLHHVCYRVHSVAASLEKLKAQGLQVIDDAPRLGSRGKWIAFLHPKSCQGVLLEICGEK